MRVLEEIRMLSGCRDHQGEGAAHHPRRAAGAATTSSMHPSSSSSRSACACAFTCRRSARARRAPTSSIAWRWPAPAIARSSPRTPSPLIYRYYRRRAAPDQHAVRHGHDGRLHRRSRHRDARGHRQRRRRSCSGSTTLAHRPRLQRAPRPSGCHRRCRPAPCPRPARPADAGAHPGRHRRAHRAGDPAAPGPRHRRAHAGQRPADRQPLRQPPSLPDHHHARSRA